MVEAIENVTFIYILNGVVVVEVVVGNRPFVLEWNLSKADTIGTTSKCLFYGSVHFIESLTKSVSHINQLALASIAVKVIGKRVIRFSSYGLAILMNYSDLVPLMVIEWIKRHSARELEIMQNSTERCMK